MLLTFEERDRRYREFRKKMDEADLSVLVVASNAMFTGYVRYFTAYPAFYGYTYLVFPREGTPTLFVMSKIQEQIACKRWVSDSRQSSNYAVDVVKRIRELGGEGQRIGLVGVENISFGNFEYFSKEMPGATFVNFNREISGMRMVKSAEEQGIARQCAKITDALYERVKEVARPGASEYDVYAEMDYFMRKRGVETAFNLITTAKYPVAPLLTPSDHVLQEGESLLLELTPRWEGYYTQIAVVTPMGEPDAKLKRFFEVGAAAQKLGVEALKPGNRACDVAVVMKEYIEKAGYRYLYRGGHSMGHDLDEPPAITPEDKTVLKPGMMLVVHPCVMDANGDGVFLGDSHLITEAGSEPLNRTVLNPWAKAVSA